MLIYGDTETRYARVRNFVNDIAYRDIQELFAIYCRARRVPASSRGFSQLEGLEIGLSPGGKKPVSRLRNHTRRMNRYSLLTHDD